jgi:hypothetical protein
VVELSSRARAQRGVRSVACAVALIGLIAVAGAVEGTAPSGMYY